MLESPAIGQLPGVGFKSVPAILLVDIMFNQEILINRIKLLDKVQTEEYCGRSVQDLTSRADSRAALSLSSPSCLIFLAGGVAMFRQAVWLAGVGPSQRTCFLTALSAAALLSRPKPEGLRAARLCKR